MYFIDQILLSAAINQILESIAGNFFSLFCHQDQSILIQIEGKDILLCPRCCGLQLGFFISLVYFSLEHKKRVNFSGLFPILICVSGLIIIFIEWLFAQHSVIPSTDFSRLTTGLIAGAIFGVLALQYRRSKILFLRQEKKFTGISILKIVSLAILLGHAVILIRIWSVITFILICVVSVNLIVVLFSILQRLYALCNFNSVKIFNHEKIKTNRME